MLRSNMAVSVKCMPSFSHCVVLCISVIVALVLHACAAAVSHRMQTRRMGVAKISMS